MPRLVIIDGNALIHRAYHALPPLTTKDGVMVNAVYGFASILLKIWRELKPTHIAAAFDVAGRTFRHERYEAYKATRVKADQELYDQIPLVHELVRAFNIPIYTKTGYEADDIIGTIAEHDKKMEIFIVTGDMDTVQLLRPGVKIYTLRKGMSDVVIYDEAAATERYGFPPERLVDFKALAGDSSDNIKGVPGIGEKTATQLIQELGSVEEIYKKLEAAHTKKTIKEAVYKKLAAGKEEALLSKMLATIDRAVPDVGFRLEDAAVKPLDRDKLVALFQRFEFSSLLKRLPELGAAAGGAAGTGGSRPSAAGKIARQTSAAPATFKKVENDKDAAAVAALIREQGSYACAPIIEGTILGGNVHGLVIVVGHAGWFVPGEHLGPFQDIFRNEKLQLVGHDLKELVKLLMRAPLRNKLFDVMIASYLLSPGSRAHDPAAIILKVLGRELPAASGQASLFGADYQARVQELHLLAQAAAPLAAELRACDNYGLLEKIEMPLVPVLADMELNGVAVDTAKLAAISARITADIKKITRKIYEYSGVEFNIASPLQLREVLFEKMNIPVEGIKKGKTGLSTGAEQLEKLRGLHPIIEEIANYRELTKLQNTYSDVLPTLINPATNRIHTHFNQTVAATGRLSSSDPNLQNIPVRTALGREIRTAFIAEQGNILVSADYSQIELRIVASLAEDKKMMQIFEDNLDIHTATAAAINGVALGEVTKEMRYGAKEINFGVLYGMGTYGLSWRAHIPHWQAKEFIDKYFREFAGVKKYIDTTLEFTTKAGYCETLFGRRRYIPELQSKNFQLRAAGERMAVNHPIQGTAADLMKMAMIEVDARLKARATEFPPEDVRMIVQVHDELVLEVKKGLEKDVGRLLRETMESVVKLRVPVKVEIKTGSNWGEMEKTG